MTGTTTSPPTDQPRAVLASPPPRRRGRRLAGAAGVVLVVGVVAWVAGMFDTGHARSAGVSDNEHPTSITTVTQGTLSSQISADGTLEYTTSGGPDYSVVNQAAGTFTSLPRAGAVFSRGRVLYRVSNDLVILLYGNTPVYRSLYEDDTGPDVRELNRNLVALGYAISSELDPSSDYFNYETAYTLERLQYHLGEDETGSLAEGQAVFLAGRPGSPRSSQPWEQTRVRPRRSCRRPRPAARWS